MWTRSEGGVAKRPGMFMRKYVPATERPMIKSRSIACMPRARTLVATITNSRQNREGEADPGARMNVERLAAFADRELRALGVGQQRRR